MYSSCNSLFCSAGIALYCEDFTMPGLPLDFADNEGDLFGDAYEFLISNYAANAGKSGGEYFTPTHVSNLIAQIAMHCQPTVNNMYDPACAAGTVLLQVKHHYTGHTAIAGLSQ